MCIHDILKGRGIWENLFHTRRTSYHVVKKYTRIVPSKTNSSHWQKETDAGKTDDSIPGFVVISVISKRNLGRACPRQRPRPFRTKRTGGKGNKNVRTNYLLGLDD
ncbi:hypothetical protein GUITHDRAFT_151391 [Guillardia theta CCMP2712]|uniref:Uncharacterized protein n=1 Tax=Guillardia theta (strain CCMP2712) TaxID=905079 RepID=L1JN66_GUITC|nr:hypothetical protein GUITHDRAFT_151391 [Guillardia theta CCMP2712]EKX49518.1 hypothetical protein GUITHDRAFT_151391 [Guillardia theta CCMP2712]|eukprot:XP_005836498.1 hypothetical protein GUITHDRAFT_151391 [Guillardia theta CCMP2712]